MIIRMNRYPRLGVIHLRCVEGIVVQLPFPRARIIPTWRLVNQKPRVLIPMEVEDVRAEHIELTKHVGSNEEPHDLIEGHAPFLLQIGTERNDVSTFEYHREVGHTLGGHLVANDIVGDLHDFFPSRVLRAGSSHFRTDHDLAAVDEDIGAVHISNEHGICVYEPNVLRRCVIVCK
jgi:hypothetical protein